MAVLSFLVSLAGATMLLLFAVRMVRTGIERSFGASFERLMTSRQNLLQASAAGVFLAVLLQSSAAVALLVSGFSAGGLVSFASGLAIVLGADLGSALVIQVLSFRLEWLVPILLAVGGWLFVKSDRRDWRQLGRILLGIAFILISLRFLREAMDPIRDSAFLPAIAEYLARDYVTAFIVGASLAFVMHSSVAAILMCVTLVQIGAIPFAAGLSLVLGANLGSAVIPIWLTRGLKAAARQVPYANLGMRGVLAVAVLFIVNSAWLQAVFQMPQNAQSLIFAHIGFNTLLLVLALPFVRVLERPIAAALADKAGPTGETVLPKRPKSQLDPANVGQPVQALSAMKKELIRMADLVESMFHPSLALYRAGATSEITAIQKLDKDVNDGLSAMRAFTAALPTEGFGKDNYKAARGHMEFAIRLEAAGDIVAKRLMVLALEVRKNKFHFSDEGWLELQRMHETILVNLRLASNVLLSDDLESARILSVEKTELKRAERDSRKRHLKRLQHGKSESFETSDIHLETLRAFREFNSHISAAAYPMLYRHGQLLESRLIENIADRNG